jgi:hypothetical protein
MSTQGNGQSKGKVDGKFSKRIEQLETQAKKMSEAFRYSNETRPWHVPDELKEKELLDVKGLDNPAWDRNDINRVYADDVLGNPATKAVRQATLSR